MAHVVKDLGGEGIDTEGEAEGVYGTTAAGERVRCVGGEDALQDAVQPMDVAVRHKAPAAGSC